MLEYKPAHGNQLGTVLTFAFEVIAIFFRFKVA